MRSLTFTVVSVFVWSVCEVVMVPYVATMTVMHALLFCVGCVYAERVCRCEGDGNTGVKDGVSDECRA